VIIYELVPPSGDRGNDIYFVSRNFGKIQNIVIELYPVYIPAAENSGDYLLNYTEKSGAQGY